MTSCRPGSAPGGLRVRTPAPAQPRSLASNPPPSSKPRPDPTRLPPPGPALYCVFPSSELSRAAASRTQQNSSARADCPAALKFLAIPPPRTPPLAALPPARPRPVSSLGSHCPEQSTQLHCPGYLHVVLFDYAGPDPGRSAPGGPACMTQLGAQVQPDCL